MEDFKNRLHKGVKMAGHFLQSVVNIEQEALAEAVFAFRLSNLHLFAIKLVSGACATQ